MPNSLPRWEHFDAAEQAGLARKVARLRPLVCIKG